MRPKWHNWAWTVGSVIIWLVAILQFAVSGAGFWAFGHPDDPYAVEVKSLMGLVLASTSALVLAAKFLQSRITEPLVYEAIEEVLEAAVRTLSKTALDKELYYRVTLYKKTTFLLSTRVYRWNVLNDWRPTKLKDWLVPVARSGELSLITETIWWAGNSRKSFVNGFAGKAWNFQSRTSSWQPGEE